jgi:DNA-binding transcriptional regulator YdaS (Cro superfamily)
MDENKNFAALRNFKILLKEVGNTKEFANKVGIHLTYVSLITTEKRKIGPVIAAKIEKAFNKPSGWLYKL